MGVAPSGDLGARKWWALGAVFLTILCVGVDSTVLSVALPTLATSLHASESDLQWFSSGYLLVLAATMLPAGLLGDRYGHKKVFLISLGLFALGSLACGYSTTVSEFMAARIVLGVAGAGVIVMAISSLTVLFSQQERPKAVGILGAGNFLAFPIGPILGGWILTNFWWGWVFLINIPIAVIGFAAAAILLPEFRAHVRPGVDLAGALPASLVARSIGSKITVAGGFALLALGLCVGASAAAASNELFVAAWLVVVGAGLGLVLTTATSAALVELSPEQSGTGSAALEAIDEIGSPLGAAILGSVVSAGYLARLGLSGLSSSAANAARQSVFAGVSVARVLRSQSLLSDVRTAFVHGVDEAMLVSAGIAVVGCVLAVLFLPRSNPSTLVLPLAQEIGAGEPSE